MTNDARRGAGLLAGVSTEADVLAVWPGAVVKRDQKMGGEVRVRVNGAPAVKITLGDDRFAWLVEVGVSYRVVLLRVPVARGCAAVLADLGSHTKPGSCTPTNRVPSPGEVEVCSATPNGAVPITITCHGDALRMWLHHTDAPNQHLEG